MEKRGLRLRIDPDSVVRDFVGDRSARAKRVRLLASEVKRLKRALEVLTERKKLW